MSLCRADKVLLSGCAAMRGSTALFGPTAMSFGVPAGLLATVLADGIFRPSSNTLYPTISHGPRSSNRVALTFDDGPHPETTPRVLDVLAQYNARATFFIMGSELETNLEYGRSLVAVGHELGNHTYSHKRMVLRSPEFIRQIRELPLPLINGRQLSLHEGRYY